MRTVAGQMILTAVGTFVAEQSITIGADDSVGLSSWNETQLLQDSLPKSYNSFPTKT